jgi:hypothetical protein
MKRSVSMKCSILIRAATTVILVSPSILAQTAIDGTDTREIGPGQITYLLQKAQSGHVQTQLELARALDSGSISRADRLAGAKWACEAAWQGNIEAQLILALLYGHYRLTWHFTAKDSWAWRVLTWNEPNEASHWVRSVTSAEVQGVPLDAQNALFWATLAAQNLPKVDPNKLHHKKYGTLKKDPSNYVIGKDSTGSPLTFELSQTVLSMRDSLSKQFDYQTLLRIGEKAGQWQPNIERPWKPSKNCQSARSDTDASAAIARIRGGTYSPLPPAVADPLKGVASDGTTFTIENNSGYQIVIYLTGPTDKAVTVESNKSITVEVIPGQYLIGVETPSASFLPFYGEQELVIGASYRETFAAR